MISPCFLGASSMYLNEYGPYRSSYLARSMKLALLYIFSQATMISLCHIVWILCFKHGHFRDVFALLERNSKIKGLLMLSGLRKILQAHLNLNKL